VDEIIAVMRAAGESPEGFRLRGVIVVLWRAGLRISEALSSWTFALAPAWTLEVAPPAVGCCWC
jgi:site-specific recombinase XerC